MTRISLFFISTVLTGSLTGCSSLLFPDTQPPQRFILEKAQPGSQKTYGGGQEFLEGKTWTSDIQVGTPHVYPPLDDQRIAVMLQKNQLDYYADIEWADRLPSLIEESLIYSLQDTYRYAHILREGDGFKEAQHLKLTVRQFHIDQTGPTYFARAEYFVTLTHTPPGKGRANTREKTFQATIPVPKDPSKEVISMALNKANQHIIQDILNWL